MANILYTGQGLATQLPQDNGSAMSRLSDFITRAEELKYNTFKQNEQEFLKNSNIDPVFFISTANQQTQANLLDEYNKKWSDRMRQTNNNLSTADKQTMLAEKNYLIAQQQKMAADQERWQQHRELVEQNPTRFDREKFLKNTQNYMQGGQYLNMMPPLKAKNFSLYLKEQSNKFNQNKIFYGTKKDEFGRLMDVYTNISDEQIGGFIEMAAMNDDQAMQGLIDDFRADNSPEKWQMLTDSNNDGRITNEDADDNVILAWAKKNPAYIDATRIITSNASKNQPTTTTGFNVKTPTSASNNQNQKFDIQENVPAYGTTFKQLMNLGRVSFTSDPQTISEYVDLVTGITKEAGKATRFEVVAYSPDKDLVIVKIVDSVRGNADLRKDNIIGLPASKYDDLLRNKPFYIDRESLLSQYSNTQPQTTEQPVNNWDKYKR